MRGSCPDIWTWFFGQESFVALLPDNLLTRHTKIWTWNFLYAKTKDALCCWDMSPFQLYSYSSWGLWRHPKQTYSLLSPLTSIDLERCYFAYDCTVNHEKGYCKFEGMSFKNKAIFFKKILMSLHALARTLADGSRFTTHNLCRKQCVYCCLFPYMQELEGFTYAVKALKITEEIWYLSGKCASLQRRVWKGQK